MTVESIVSDLKKAGSLSTKQIWMKHGAREPFYGVKIEDLKKIQKKVKKDHELALGLYKTGISDAMYLAGLIADESKMTRKDLQSWVEGAYWYMISEYTVAWVTAESPFALEMALKWIDSKKEQVAASGWSTLSSLVSIKPNAELDLPLLKKLITRVQKEIHDTPNRVCYAMNGFVIAVGGYVKPLASEAMTVARQNGKLTIDMGGTACKVPFAPDYIEKMRQRGCLDKKRKMARC